MRIYAIRKLKTRFITLLGWMKQRPEHPSTTVSAWNLFLTLRDLGERSAARAVLERDLLWLIDRDPATLGAGQRKIREMVAEAVKAPG
jgi:hypothetical protein